MEKLICTNTGAEVKMGDKFKIKGKVSTPFGDVNTIQVITVSKETLGKLMELGVIRKGESERVDTNKISMDLEYYIQKVADKLDWHIDKTSNYLRNIIAIYPAAFLNIMLREIAVELDKHYSDHINNCNEFFVVSLANGKISKMYKAQTKNFKNFAAFRTLEDAKIACRIMKPFLKEMFKSEERK